MTATIATPGGVRTFPSPWPHYGYQEDTTTSYVRSWPPRDLPTVPHCQVCGAEVTVFLDHGQQPIANGFRDPGDTAPEPTYPIQYGWCPDCYLVQLLAQPPAEVLFNERYAFLTGSSEGMRRYYAQMAAELRAKWQPRSVIEIGCNDGTLLANFRDLDHLGIEPSKNVAALARQAGLHVWERFWNPETACLVASTWGACDQDIQRLCGRNVDLIVACHVLTHLHDIGDFFAAADIVLAPNGVLVLEDPSLDVIITNRELDQFYDEHQTVLSLPALQRVLARYGFEVIAAEPKPVHGGSMRVTAARQGARRPSPGLAAALQAEKYLTQPYSYKNFGEDAANKVAKLGELLRSLHADGHLVAGYGASSKLALVLNRLKQAAPDAPSPLEYVSDTTPTKVGKVMPGTHEPIISRAEAETRLPSTFLLGAWVHAREVLAKERAYLEAGGRFIVWNPTVRVIGKESL